MTNRYFNFDKFRVFIRLTVKSTASHSRMTWAEWQTYKGRITRFFGEYTWRPSLLQGSTKLCSLTKSPQVIFHSRRTSRISRIVIAMLNEQEAPKQFVIMAYKPDPKGSHSYARWAGSPQVTIWNDNRLIILKMKRQRPWIIRVPSLLYSS